jgi:hypothetical protein
MPPCGSPNEQNFLHPRLAEPALARRFAIYPINAIASVQPAN